MRVRRTRRRRASTSSTPRKCMPCRRSLRRKALFNRLRRHENPQTNRAIESYLAIARKHGLDPSQMANRFVTTRPFVTSNIIGATTMEQLKLAVTSVDVKWTGELEKEIDAAHLDQPNPAP
ncbi:MAG: aldo/keto reductase [Parvibaculum sp.]|nr:aldo/keto reductase [Parvibaculum sp.]